MGDRDGGDPDPAAAVIERLQQGPPAAARREARWTLRAIRDLVPAVAGYSLSGIWRLVTRTGLAWRTARAQQFSPDPDSAAKRDYLLSC